jgi:hypothetical protein
MKNIEDTQSKPVRFHTPHDERGDVEAVNYETDEAKPNIPASKISVIVLFVIGFILAGCSSAPAAPPYVSPSAHATSLTLTPSADPRVTGYNFKAYPPGAVAWTNVLTIPAPQTNAYGILTNFPVGTAYTATATDSVDQVESDGSNIVTNNTALVAPTGIIGH